MQKIAKCLALALVVSLGATVGCSTRQMLTSVGIGAAAAAGVAGAYYVKGDLEADIDRAVVDAHRAAVLTVKDRGYSIETETYDDDQGVVKARIPASKDENERTVTIKTSPSKDDYGKTHVSIRIGVFGDEALSRAILNDLEKQARLVRT